MGIASDKTGMATSSSAVCRVVDAGEERDGNSCEYKSSC